MVHSSVTRIMDSSLRCRPITLVRMATDVHRNRCTVTFVVHVENKLLRLRFAVKTEYMNGI